MTRKTQKKLRKLLTLVSCAVLLVCVTIVGTIAYLSDTTEVVNNTFTVGQGIEITLDETKVAQDKTTGNYIAATPAGRTQHNEYDLHPGISVLKDPTIHVKADDCWVVAKITVSAKDMSKVRSLLGDANGILGLQGIVTGGVFNETFTGANGVYSNDNYKLEQKVDGDKNEFYVYYKKVQSKDADLTIFDNITIPGTWTSNELSALTGLNIDVIAYAIQAEGFSTVEDAWNAAIANNDITA